MKKSLLALLAVASFVACSRDDDKSTATPPHSDIVGVWKQEKMVTFSGKDNSVLDTELPDDCEKKGSLEFTKDGKYISKSFLEDSKGVCIEDGSEEGTYTYDASTKKIVTIVGNDKNEGKVISLTATEFQILERDDLDVNNDGVKDRIITFFKKQK